MGTIIDNDEHVKSLNLGLLQTLTIEHDKGTLKGDPVVNVSAAGISLGIGSSILIQHHAELTLNGVISANVLGTIEIGDNGALALKSTIGVGLLSNIEFVATHGVARLVIDTTKVQLTGNIVGFGAHDNIQMTSMAATSEVWTQGLLGSGTLAMFNAAGTEVGALGLAGIYTSANFTLKDFVGPNGNESTKISFVTPAEQTPSAGTMRDVHGTEAMLPSHLVPGMLHG
jgi:hypothetical protein